MLLYGKVVFITHLSRLELCQLGFDMNVNIDYVTYAFLFRYQIFAGSIYRVLFWRLNVQVNIKNDSNTYVFCWGKFRQGIIIMNRNGNFCKGT